MDADCGGVKITATNFAIYEDCEVTERTMLNDNNDRNQ